MLICTPPVYHVEEALAALQARAHVFIEKPLSHESSGIQALISEARRRDRMVQIGYNMRFHPGLQILKELVDSGKIGRVLWLNVEAGQYLPDWRPWQHYRESYSARQELGGGIILDGSHELDYICWLLGRPTEVTCRAEHLSSLDVDVEDSAWIYLTFPERRRAELHLGFCAEGLHAHLQGRGRDGDGAVGFQCPGSALVFRPSSRAGTVFRTHLKRTTCMWRRWFTSWSRWGAEPGPWSIWSKAAM